MTFRKVFGTKLFLSNPRECWETDSRKATLLPYLLDSVSSFSLCGARPRRQAVLFPPAIVLSTCLIQALCSMFGEGTWQSIPGMVCVCWSLGEMKGRQMVPSDLVNKHKCPTRKMRWEVTCYFHRQSHFPHASRKRNTCMPHARWNLLKNYSACLSYKASITFICWSNKDTLIRYKAAGSKIGWVSLFLSSKLWAIKKNQIKGDFYYFRYSSLNWL